MEPTLKKYGIVLILLVLMCGCCQVCAHSQEVCVYVSYAPVKESLSFINNGVCIYTRIQ